MSRKPYRVHHWTVGHRFPVPIPAGHVGDFTIERELHSGQLFAVWVEDAGDGHSAVRWSRAPELHAAWRTPSTLSMIQADVFAPELQLARDRLMLTYLVSPTFRVQQSAPGDCILHWKKAAGGPWSEGVLVRRDVPGAQRESSFPYLQRLGATSTLDGRVWQLVITNRFVEPTYALYPLAALERSTILPNPWEDELIYTGILAGAADRARLVWDKNTWHIVRRVYEDSKNSYGLEAIALEMAIIQHDQNIDGQTDVVDSILEIYDDELQYMLWSECDYAALAKEVGTLVAVRNPDHRSGRVDPSAKHVFETASTLAQFEDTRPRLRANSLEIVGRGQQLPVEALRRAASPVSQATQWQPNKPDSMIFAVDCQLRAHQLKWLLPGMVLGEPGIFSNATAFEAQVEWRVDPASEGWSGYAHILGASYKALLVDVAPLSSPARHRSSTWVGKLYSHSIRCHLEEPAPLTLGLRLALFQVVEDKRFKVFGIARVSAINPVEMP
ncbi:MAG: hypothetical protein RBU37_08660 [Myxococcota bacterium]|jgi:hypothetical protein|nr:hypothetical protein [Myxococcota bacterium]